MPGGASGAPAAPPSGGLKLRLGGRSPPPKRERTPPPVTVPPVATNTAPLAAGTGSGSDSPASNPSPSTGPTASPSVPPPVSPSGEQPGPSPTLGPSAPAADAGAGAMGPPRPLPQGVAAVVRHTDSADVSQYLFDPFVGKGLCFDDETQSLRRMVRVWCHQEHAEVEARLGVLRQVQGGERLKYPFAYSSFVCSERKDHRFDASVGREGFLNVNRHMNYLVEKHQKQEQQVKYTKTVTRDLILQQMVEGREALVRATLGATDDKVQCCVEKVTKESFDVLAQQKSFDTRWRASLEIPRPTPDLADPAVWSQVRLLRRKERRSYRINCFTVDLTVVQEWRGPFTGGLAAIRLLPTQDGVQLRYEVEMEMDLEALRKYAPMPQKVNRFGELCRLFVDNVRGLASVASDSSPPVPPPAIAPPAAPKPRRSPAAATAPPGVGAAAGGVDTPRRKRLRSPEALAARAAAAGEGGQPHDQEQTSAGKRRREALLAAAAAARSPATASAASPASAPAPRPG
eukprot:TRINITY_DN17812_c0_g1_i1.p1 TRINITY_DN17812_c0_g1~~TRINITY_DN17812_c0_g1_i1.p1  ORF type:complete len:546 (+),score=139.85 TRINITY_DN17812_c0_g1_i1:96-1640(+)